eukprot:Gb_06468 [translate_table: standard]
MLTQASDYSRVATARRLFGDFFHAKCTSRGSFLHQKKCDNIREFSADVFEGFVKEMAGDVGTRMGKKVPPLPKVGTLNMECPFVLKLLGYVWGTISQVDTTLMLSPLGKKNSFPSR